MEYLFQIVLNFRMIKVKPIKRRPVAAGLPRLSFMLQDPVGMFLEQVGLLFCRKWCQPYTCFESGRMDGVCLGFHSAGELPGIRIQPVSDIGFPAIINLKQVTRFKDRPASFQIILNCRFRDVLIPVVPAGIAIEFPSRKRLDSSSFHPAVKYF